MSSCAHWGYSENNGPATWEKNLSLKVGNKQSPIDIVQSKASFDATLKSLKFSYPSFQGGSLLNNGNTALYQPSDNDNTSAVSHGPVNNKYKLAQFHFHWGQDCDTGSEHTVDGKPYSGELHLVHWNTELYPDVGEALTSNNGLTVFGIFLQAGDHDHPGLKKITSNLSEIEKSGSKIVLPDSFNPSCLFPASLDYWSYPGSLTTPPLSESVTWVVFKNPINVSKTQIEAFRQLENGEGEKLSHNYRPCCPLNQRQVKASFK